MSILSKSYFHNEEDSYKFVESRVWPDGPVCPRCGGMDRIGELKGKSTRIGTYKCYECRKPFTVKVGTIFESSHIPMHLWLQAIFLISSSKKGISSNQLHRTLGVTLKSAWFMTHRIREAMKDGNPLPLGGNGGTVEVDETFIGKAKEKNPKSRGYAHKHKVLSLVERGGRSRSIVVDSLKASTIVPIIMEQVKPDSRIMTDEANQYQSLHKVFPDHHVVCHSAGEYVRGDVTTNTIEGFFSIFKRGMKGVYQHCRKNHLNRYLAEFDFRYSNREANGVDDQGRADLVLKGVVGKRLTYKTAH